MSDTRRYWDGHGRSGYFLTRPDGQMFAAKTLTSTPK